MAEYSNVRAIPIPHVYGLKNRRVSAMINTHLTTLVRRLLREQGYGHPKVAVWTEQSMTLNELGVFSLWYDVYSYRQQAAHGLTVRTSATYNLLTGKPYQLAELFMPNSDYIGRISAIISKQIAEQELPLIAEFQSIRADEGFFMTPEELVVYFQIYQYTPYAVGIPEFHIPYKCLLEILSPNGPAMRFTSQGMSHQ